jgi:hypothetical protein
MNLLRQAIKVDFYNLFPINNRENCFRRLQPLIKIHPRVIDLELLKLEFYKLKLITLLLPTWYNKTKFKMQMKKVPSQSKLFLMFNKN